MGTKVQIHEPEEDISHSNYNTIITIAVLFVVVEDSSKEKFQDLILWSVIVRVD